jgi:superfamily II DNA or RNA helicase
VKYDRGVGFFSSGWLRIAAKGMAEFAENGGHARWVTSPILDEDDWKALETGDAARTNALLYEVLERNIDNLITSLERDTLSAFAWLVADEVLDFKLALPRNKLDRGEFHDKFGIFTDTVGNQVSFNGSYNDSIQGTRNYESIKIFSSWIPPFSSLVESDIERFETLWDNRDSNVQVFDLPTAAKEKIVRLRFDKRPNNKSPLLGSVLMSPKEPQLPFGMKLRDYQIEAITSWTNNNYRGILEMATGTGKTLTSLAAVTRLFQEKKRFVMVIVVPYKHLVEQWSEEAEKFGFRPVRVAEAAREWQPELSRQAQSFRLGLTNHISLVATNSALETGSLSKIMSGIWKDTLFIVDEVHHAGAPGMLKSLPSETPWRLGLSATPIRHYDELGSESLINYFGDIIFEFGLDKAIGKYLTPYYYYPIPVEMTEEEFGEYCQLTRQLGKYIHSSEVEMPDVAKKIAIKRARVLNNSVSKLGWLQQNIQKYQKLTYTLFYVGDPLFESVKQLLGVEKRLRIHEFTQRQNNAERQGILDLFGRGELQALVAMKCLDEGVDVPPTREAYFLASSGNPREFIQRRGRVLRLFPGKEYAIIRDLVSIPPMDFIEMGNSHPDFPAVRSSFSREYKRVKEFSALALNHYQALDPMFEIAQKLNILDA